MKQLGFSTLGMLLLMSINSYSQVNKPGVTSNSNASKATQKQVEQLPYSASLSSKVEMGNPDHVKMLLTLYKDYETNEFTHADWIADTIAVFFSNGVVVKGKEKVIEAYKQNRNNFSAFSFEPHVWMPVRLSDRNENWVLIWEAAKFVTKDGAKGTAYTHETWRINQDGKVDLMRQYEMKTPPGNQ
jgi:hypothetical protein